MGNLQRCNSGNSSICFNTRDARFHTGCLVVSTTINTANYVSLLSALCFLSLGVNKRGGDKGGIKSKVIRDEANVWCSQDVEVKWKLVARNSCFLSFLGAAVRITRFYWIVWYCGAMLRETLLTRGWTWMIGVACEERKSNAAIK